jgi:hypothetical protein
VHIKVDASWRGHGLSGLTLLSFALTAPEGGQGGGGIEGF